MKIKIYTLLTLLVSTTLITKVSAQNKTYFTEYFDDAATAITGTTANAAIVPTTATIKSGTWTTYYSLRAGTGCTPQDPTVSSAKGLRVLGTTASTPAGLAANSNGPNAYLITPKLDFGVDTVYWKNVSTSSTGTISVYYSTNDGGSWTLAETITSTGTGCDNYFTKINIATANKIKFQAQSSTSADLDNITITSVNAIVPVKFGDINLSFTNGIAKINWNVLLEINTEKYHIERSATGRDFVAVGSLSASNAKAYSFIDAAPLNVTGFYRIKAVDKDGKLSYSNVVRLNTKKLNTEVLVTPNPITNGTVNLQLNNFTKSTYTVSLFDASGRIAFTNKLNVEAGSSAQTLQLPNIIAKGMYQLQITNGSTKINKAVVVQ
jgi:hypothetical protein